jgi:transposase
VYVKVTTTRAGNKTYRYLSLVESYREGAKVRQRTVARLGEATAMAASGELANIVAGLQSHLGGGVGELSAEAAPSFGGMAAVAAYFERLGLDELFKTIGRSRKTRHLASTVLVMVANRLLLASSKRRLVTDWLGQDVALPDGVAAPSLDQCYRALDAVCAAKEDIEAHCYRTVCDLTNLDLRLCCYDLTSTYLEGDPRPSARFCSKAFGYSRDHRPDRPQVVIGLLVTGDGVPISHYVFAGNTTDISTLPEVLNDLQHRFGVAKIALVADRGLISGANLAAVAQAGFDHVIATRLHRDPTVRAVLEAASQPAAKWLDITSPDCSATEVTHEGRRYVVVCSPERKARDDARREQLLERTEERLAALAERVSSGRLKDPAKISLAADRILRGSPVGRFFVTHLGQGSFVWDFDSDALAYEQDLLAGRYVVSTSLSAQQASTADVVRHYRSLERVERRFRVLKDFLGLRPIYHFTEARVRGHIAICVLASVIEAVMGRDLTTAGITDPDITEQACSPRRALRELSRIRSVTLNANDGSTRRVITRPTPLQASILSAFKVDTRNWASRLS